MYLACQQGQYDTVKIYLDLNGQTANRRVDTIIKRPDGWLFLHVACFGGHTEVLRLLIGVGLIIENTANKVLHLCV